MQPTVDETAFQAPIVEMELYFGKGDQTLTVPCSVYKVQQLPCGYKLACAVSGTGKDRKCVAFMANVTVLADTVPEAIVAAKQKYSNLLFTRFITPGNTEKGEEIQFYFGYHPMTMNVEIIRSNCPDRVIVVPGTTFGESLPMNLIPHICNIALKAMQEI